MKFFIINSFRFTAYVAFFAIIGYGIRTGFYNDGNISSTLSGMPLGPITQALDVVLGLVGGWIVASISCGLILTLLDIRDNIDNRLPDAQQDE